MSAFENFDRLAMSEAQFLRMAEAEYQQAQSTRTPQSTFVARFFKSPSLGTSTLNRNNYSPSASPSLSASPANSPRMSTNTFGASPQMSPSMGAGWGLGLVFRKRSSTNASSLAGGTSPRMGGTSPHLGAASPRMGGAGVVEGHVRSPSGDSSTSDGGKRDEFGLARNKWVAQLF